MINQFEGIVVKLGQKLKMKSRNLRSDNPNLESVNSKLEHIERRSKSEIE